MSSKSSLRVKSKNLTKALQGSCLSLPVHPLAPFPSDLDSPSPHPAPTAHASLLVHNHAGPTLCLRTFAYAIPSVVLLHTSSVSYSHLFRGPPRTPCQHNSPIWHLSSCFIFFPSIFHPPIYFKCICLCLYGPSFSDSKLYEGRHCPQGEAIEGF